MLGKGPISLKRTEVKQACLPLGRRLKQVTGDLPIVPLWGEDRSSSRANSDLKADFNVALCEGVFWH